MIEKIGCIYYWIQSVHKDQTPYHCKERKICLASIESIKIFEKTDQGFSVRP